MSTKYPPQSITGYNLSPPSDDGVQVASNQLTWVKHKTKLGDPLKNLAESINTSLVAHFDNGPTALSTATTTNATHYNQILEVTGTTTISLFDAGTATSGYFLIVYNADAALTTTINLDTAGNTLDGTVGGSTTLDPGEAKGFIVNAGEDGYLTYSWVVVNPAKIDTAYVSSPVTWTSDTVAKTTGLSVSNLVEGKYSYEYFLFLNDAGFGGMDVSLALSGITHTASQLESMDFATTNSMRMTVNGSASLIGATDFTSGAVAVVKMVGSFFTTNGINSFDVQAAQNSSSTGGLTVDVGSTLKITRVA